MHNIIIVIIGLLLYECKILLVIHAVVMRIKRTGTEADPRYIWSSHIWPENYLGVNSDVHSSSLEVTFRPVS